MKKIIKSLVLLLIPVSLAGQLTPVTNQYILNPLTINPSYAGSRGGLSVAAAYQAAVGWAHGAPRTMSLERRCSRTLEQARAGPFCGQ
ncbi:MAG: type IX secretion system membrane protein PorP/SprF [Bacteroidales bacterium]|nr:type IX secretion system membrane protein PorP/SprF [Bacteroidales bacterium]